MPAAFDAAINCFFVSTDMHWPFYEQPRRGLKLLLARGSERGPLAETGSGISGARPAGYFMVRCPCCSRALSVSIFLEGRAAVP